MKFDVQSNIAQVRRELQVTAVQARSEAVNAINETAFDVRRGLQAEIRKVFDRPTPFIVNALRVVPATSSRLIASIYPDDPGGKAVDPVSVLQAEVYGGRRNAKRAESAFQRIGALPKGFGMVPGAAAPLDAYGNVPGPFIVQLISYFQAFGEQGYRANMSDKRKAQLARRGRWINGRFVKSTEVARRGLGKQGARAQGQGGVEYFISRGKDVPAWARGAKEGHTQHLPAGIWQRKGLHGEDIKPVFLFVRMPAGYRIRLHFDAVAEAIARRQFPCATVPASSRLASATVSGCGDALRHGLHIIGASFGSALGRGAQVRCAPTWGAWVLPGDPVCG